jgi:hypothetical protein
MKLSVLFKEETPELKIQFINIVIDKDEDGGCYLGDIRRALIAALDQTGYLISQNYAWRGYLGCDVEVKIKPFSRFREVCLETLHNYANKYLIENVTFVDSENTTSLQRGTYVF